MIPQVSVCAGFQDGHGTQVQCTISVAASDEELSRIGSSKTFRMFSLLRVVGAEMSDMSVSTTHHVGSFASLFVLATCSLGTLQLLATFLAVVCGAASSRSRIFFDMASLPPHFKHFTDWLFEEMLCWPLPSLTL